MMCSIFSLSHLAILHVSEEKHGRLLLGHEIKGSASFHTVAAKRLNTLLRGKNKLVCSQGTVVESGVTEEFQELQIVHRLDLVNGLGRAVAFLEESVLGVFHRLSGLVRNKIEIHHLLYSVKRSNHELLVSGVHPHSK